MHIIIGFLTTLVTVLYLLDRLGIDLGGMNPFDWRRRRAWLKKYGGDPVYAVDDPMEIAALFIVGIAKIGGDITAEEKRLILEAFSSNFALGEREALHLFGSSVHLLAHPQLIGTQLGGILSRRDDHLTGDQAESLISMMRSVLSLNENVSAEQSELMEAVSARFSGNPRKGTWG